MKRRLMIVDDEEGILQALRRLLRSTPCAYGKLRYELEVEAFSSPRTALARLREGGAAFDLFLSDYRMPEMDGLEFLRQATLLQPDAARLILSGQADREAIDRAFAEIRIYRFIDKPWNDSVLASAIAEALNHRDLLREARPRGGQGGA